MRNEGKLNASFQLRYPTEMELQIEHWADKGEPTAVELKQHLIVDRGIMEVAPKAAAPAPGAAATIRVTMRNFTKYVEHQVDDSPLYIFDSSFAKRISNIGHFPDFNKPSGAEPVAVRASTYLPQGKQKEFVPKCCRPASLSPGASSS